ncbi:MAG: flagellar basal body L-ring protein FlgH [Pseudomonadota bacterium]|jgi:flagellar L-ring protein precursor FlgH|nr:flagellar basal body L-ring protein FlgH [Alphaproteobacteria bacterium]
MVLRNLHVVLLLLSLLLPGCNLATKLSTIGEPPQMTQIKDPRDVPGYEPVHMPMPEAMPAPERTNSLWQTGSRAFFKDQRAGKVGDVVTVVVEIDRSQNMQMTPNIQRQSSLNSSVSEVLGHAFPIQKRLSKALPGKHGQDGDLSQNNPAANSNTPSGLTGNWVGVTSNPTHSSTASYDVKDKINFTMSAVIIQVLPNGNMVIQGREEVRLVNELREVELKGVVRREDITSSNKVHSQKIANLRISYGGRGDLSDAQQAPWGQQYLNKLLPF